MDRTLHHDDVDPQAVPAHEPMAPGAAVALLGSACLRLRSRLAVCRSCVEACPVQALQAGSQRLELRLAACIGCGRCQAVCPTGALQVDGFDATTGPEPREGERLIECARDAADGAWTVPCLGGLSEAQLLTLVAAAPDVPLVLVDRGGCARCPAGVGESPVHATLHRLAMWLDDAGVPRRLRPRIERRAPPSRRTAAADAMQPEGRARRSFLGALARPAASSSVACNPARSAASPARQRTLAALRTLAAHHGGRMPGALFHQLELGSGCQGHRVCAAACPTGALLRWRDDRAARMGVAFDGQACIGCGHCVAVCPEQALRLRLGAGPGDAPRRPLNAFVQRECPSCGTRFATRDSETQSHCDRCRKAAGLARSAFQTLFGDRP